MPVCFEVLCIVAFSLSILSSILLNLLLRNNKSNYSKLMKYICLSEAIFIYCEFIIIFNFFHNFDFFWKIVNVATFGM